MKISRIQIAYLFLIGLSIGTALAQSGIEEDGISVDNLTQSESNYLNLSNAVWNMYSEDLIYASQILDEFVKNNISSRNAMMATTSVYILDSITASNVDKVNPPEKFILLHRDTAQAFNYLEGYLWNLAKYYETGAGKYASIARDSFNSSILFKGKAEEQRTKFAN